MIWTTNHRLFVGCRSPAMLVYDMLRPFMTSVPISRVRTICFTTLKINFYSIVRAGDIEVIKQSARKIIKNETIPTASGARTSLSFWIEIALLAVPIAEVRRRKSCFKTHKLQQSANRV